MYNAVQFHYSKDFFNLECWNLRTERKTAGILKKGFQTGDIFLGAWEVDFWIWNYEKSANFAIPLPTLYTISDHNCMLSRGKKLYISLNSFDR